METSDVIKSFDCIFKEGKFRRVAEFHMRLTF